MTNNFYKFTMQQTAEKPARLDLFGVIGGGFWEEGFNVSTLKEDLKFVNETQPLDIYLNSPGGSVFAGIAIYNLLKQHKGEIKIYVMGLAASAATLITSIPKAKVIMPTGSMLMVHGVSLSLYGAKAPQIKDAAVTVEKIEKSVRDIYSEKTNLSEDELKSMMEHDTYLTAEEAVKKGFADEVDSTIKIENSITDKFVMFNGVAAELNLFKNAPEGFLNKLVPPTPQNTIFNHKEETMTLAEMKEKYPELCEQLCAEAKAEGVKMGVKQERDRIKAVEEMAMAGHEELTKKAKFESDMSAEQFAVEMLKAEKKQRETIQNNLEKDMQESGLGGVGSPAAPVTEKTEEERMREEVIAHATARLKEMEG